MKETEIHQAFAAWLGRHGYGYLHARTDKRTTSKKGDPDFLVARDGRCIFIEIKVPGGKRSPAQLKRAKELEEAGNVVEVAYSLQECIFAVYTLMGMNAYDRASIMEKAYGGRMPNLDCEGVPPGGKGKIDTEKWTGQQVEELQPRGDLRLLEEAGIRLVVRPSERGKMAGYDIVREATQNDLSLPKAKA
jgi:hypothetical protein